MTWSDHPTLPGTPIKAAHINELRAAANAAGVAPPGGWTDGPTVTTSTPIRAKHVVELRQAIQQLWTTCGIGNIPTWTSGTEPGGSSVGSNATPIWASDINDLRTWFPSTLRFDPDLVSVSVDTIFSMAVVIDAGEQLVDGIEFHVDFDPTKLLVSDGSGNPVSEITPGTAFSAVLENSADNNSGSIDFSASDLEEPFPTGSFTVATITFKAVAAGNLLLTFLMAGSSRTSAQFGGYSLAVCPEAATVIIS